MRGELRAIGKMLFSNYLWYRRWRGMVWIYWIPYGRLMPEWDCFPIRGDHMEYLRSDPAWRKILLIEDHR